MIIRRRTFCAKGTSIKSSKDFNEEVEKMSYEGEKEILGKEIEKINKEIKDLSYQLSELLNVDCNLGVCSFDPQVDNIQDKMKEIEEKKKLLLFLKENLDRYNKEK